VLFDPGPGVGRDPLRLRCAHQSGDQVHVLKARRPGRERIRHRRHYRVEHLTLQIPPRRDVVCGPHDLPGPPTIDGEHGGDRRVGLRVSVGGERPSALEFSNRFNLNLRHQSRQLPSRGQGGEHIVTAHPGTILAQPLGGLTNEVAGVGESGRGHVLILLEHLCEVWDRGRLEKPPR
jgi:hypothetical protein